LFREHQNKKSFQVVLVERIMGKQFIKVITLLNILLPNRK